MLKEFKEFISRGSIIELAVAVVIGTAFVKVVDSLVNDVIMPPIGLALNNVDFSNLFINLGRVDFQTLAEARAAGAPTINYGLFIIQVISFLIVAFVIFLMIKQLTRFRRASDPAAPTTSVCPQCIMAIPIGAKRCPHCTSILV